MGFLVGGLVTRVSDGCGFCLVLWCIGLRSVPCLVGWFLDKDLLQDPQLAYFLVAYYQLHGQVWVLPASWKTSCFGYWIGLQIGWSGLGQSQKGTGAKPQGSFRFHSQDRGL